MLSVLARQLAQQMLDGWTEDKYVKLDYAVDINSLHVEATSENAVRWCASGYLGKLEYERLYDMSAVIELRDAVFKISRISLIKLNDTRGWQAVRDCLQKVLDNG